MTVETHRQLNMLLEYMKEGEALFDEAFCKEEENFEASHIKSEIEDKIIRNPMNNLNIKKPQYKTHKNSKTERILRAGIETHLQAKQLLQQANSNPAFTFDLLRC